MYFSTSILDHIELYYLQHYRKIRHHCFPNLRATGYLCIRLLWRFAAASTSQCRTNSTDGPDLKREVLEAVRTTVCPARRPVRVAHMSLSRLGSPPTCRTHPGQTNCHTWWSVEPRRGPPPTPGVGPTMPGRLERHQTGWPTA
jgi:hypothetical protein